MFGAPGSKKMELFWRQISQKRIGVETVVGGRLPTPTELFYLVLPCFNLHFTAPPFFVCAITDSPALTSVFICLLTVHEHFIPLPLPLYHLYVASCSFVTCLP